MTTRRPDALGMLWPPPRSASRGDGALDLTRPLSLDLCRAGDRGRRAAKRVSKAFRDVGRELLPTADRATGDAASVRLELRSTGAPESYRLQIAPGGAELVASDAAGLGHAAATLAQWLRLHASGGGTRLPAALVDDAPSFPVRGVMLDVSRDKVPSQQTLFGLVELLAGWKINQLQLYTEHTFAYQGHEEVWRDASPLTAQEVRDLDRHCADNGIELVPNQNSFGHFHRWLRHDRYRPLAEVPEGLEHPFGDAVEPFSLCAVDSRVLQLLADLYDQLLPCFRSRLVNVGLDETFDLGRGRSAAACDEIGRERVYLSFVRSVHRLLAERGRRMMFWADVILEHPQLIPELPSDAIALDWGYEADHPFDDELGRFAAAGLEFWACPGTSSWNSLGGRLDNALLNLARAVTASRRHGAEGILITDWGDFGHLQPLPVSYPGLLAGAGMAWNDRLADEVDGDQPATARPWAKLLDLHAFDDAAAGLGQPLVDLGRVPRLVGARPRHSSPLFTLLAFPQRPLDDRRYAGMSRRHLDAAADRLDEIGTVLGRSSRHGHELARRELDWVRRLLHLACRLGSERLAAGGVAVEELPAAHRDALAATLRPLIDRHRELWLARNRAGGLDDSASRLRRLAGLLTSNAEGTERRGRIV